MNRGITKAFTAGGAVVRRRLVKFSADFTVVQAAAATDALCGITDGSSDTISGGRVDVHKIGIVDVDDPDLRRWLFPRIETLQRVEHDDTHPQERIRP